MAGKHQQVSVLSIRNIKSLTHRNQNTTSQNIQEMQYYLMTLWEMVGSIHLEKQ